ncbi:LLM class flavin-dependent oxidoreductase [Asanoa siamensis]|uniref:Luciferase-like domain-containing protein n=1 Tax=Asanoa siamensis TaxID=926357 RepID=A0ABQ4CRC5_9ACTN|nr:LLM class flavin-dependent oxidoreductase [Asanoa siamensis]GIF73858.1 hypothetical protein Asi02nite_33760 [Asanoa siamensis]
MRYALGLPTVGIFGEIGPLVDLAVSAESHGWDGIQLWDHLLFDEPGWPVTSSTVAAAAIAARTSRVQLILTVVLPRRQVQDVARDTAALSALSGGRLTVLATIGSLDEEYAAFGLDPSLRARGRALDAGLSTLTGLWSSWGVPRMPIWCGGRWPRRAGLRRAARFDGAAPLFDAARTVEDVAEAGRFLRGLGGDHLDLTIEGASSTAAEVTPYAAAGATWWVEALGWWRGDLAAAAARIAQGPPRA